MQNNRKLGFELVDKSLDSDNHIIFVMNGSKVQYNVKSEPDLQKINISSIQALIYAKNYLGISGSVTFEKSEPGIYYKQGAFRLAQVVTIVPAEELFGPINFSNIGSSA